MEQASYWTWMRRKLIEKSHVQAPATYSSDSWEEQAFAQDSAGVLGGCIWPPRSYSCSFCRREFRSAQALGGHMNVHRRDRARLKESPNPNSVESLQHNPHQNYRKSLCVHPIAQVSGLAYSKNHNSNPTTIASPLSPSRVSALSTQENCSEHTFVSSTLSSTLVRENRKGSLICDPQALPTSFSVRVFTVSDSKLGEKNLKAHDISFLDQGEDVKPDSSLNLNSVLHRNRPTGPGGHEDEGMIPSKKRKIDATPLPFFPKPGSFGRYNLQSEEIGLNPSKIEELDLELRLGDRPQVK